MNSRSQQDVENLTVSFDYLHTHTHSSGKVANDLKDDEPISPKYTEAEEGAESEGEVIINEEPVHCHSCKQDHATYTLNYCPNTPCNICFMTGHDPWGCPFLRSIPKDAEFDRAKYKISCHCGNLFNVDKWVCTECPGHPHLTFRSSLPSLQERRRLRHLRQTKNASKTKNAFNM